MPIGKPFIDWLKLNTKVMRNPPKTPKQPTVLVPNSSSDIEVIEVKKPMVHSPLLVEPRTIIQVLTDLHRIRPRWNLPNLAPVFTRLHLSYADELSRFTPSQLAALDENLDTFKASSILEYAKKVTIEKIPRTPSLATGHKRKAHHQLGPRFDKGKQRKVLGSRQPDIIELYTTSEEEDQLKDKFV